MLVTGPSTDSPSPPSHVHARSYSLSHPHMHSNSMHIHDDPVAAMRKSDLRLDEGYSGGSEETRSLSDSDTNMQLDPSDIDLDKLNNDALLGHILSLPPEQRAAIATAVLLSLSETERTESACAALRSLRTSSIASIVESLNPLLHLDPVLHLPPEITSQIFLNLSPTDLLRCATASRSWRERVLDSSLWKVFFGREGWTTDPGEMRTYESKEARRRAALSPSQKAPRRKPDGEPERSGSIKRPRESVSRHGKAPALSEGWREQHGVPEADEDLVMQDDMFALSDIRDPMCPGPKEGNMDALKFTSETHEALSPPLRPRLFHTPRDSPRINWLYLYKQRRRLEENWNKGRYVMFQLPHPDHLEDAHSECVYTIQHSRKWLVSGSRDKTIGIWDLDTQRRVRTLDGAHTASVLCLQFDEREQHDIVVSGGSDSFVVIWRFSTGEIIRKLDDAHSQSVLNLRFDDRYLITCSKDHTIKIWNRREVFADDPLVPAVARRQLEFGGLQPIKEYSLLLTLEGHGAAVNAIQVHGSQIVSASGDRTIKAWDINTGHCLRTYTGHIKGIACVQFDGRRIVSGSSDNTIRIFDSATAAEVACLPGHSNLVRTVQARFGDLHSTEEELEAAARKIDQNYYNSRRDSSKPEEQLRRRTRNAGSSDPRELCALGAKIPPGGGGNAWSRIVSGSYDETVIIWRKDSEGKWVPSKQLRQDEILQPRSRRARAQREQQNAIQATPAAAHAVQQQPASSQSSTAAAANASASGPPGQTTAAVGGQPNTYQVPAPGLPQAAQAAQPNAQPQAHGHHHHHLHHHHASNILLGHHRQRADDSNRVFKLQFDSRRIICCSQNRIIVGWDFAAGDTELEEASQFFGDSD